MKANITIAHSAKYVLGLFLLALAVILGFRAGYGASSADNLTYILAVTLHLTLGTASFLVCTVIILFLILYFRNYRFLFLFFQVVVFAPLMDLWDLVLLANFHPEGAMQAVTFMASLVLMPMACAILIRTTYPAGVYDELMFFTAKVTRFRLPIARLFNELWLIGLALVISFSTGNGFGSVRLGTFAYAFSIGFTIKMFLILSDKIFTRRR